MGTTYTIKYYGGEVDPDDLGEQVEEYLKNFNQIFSTYIPDSEISRLNQAPDTVKVQGISVTPEFQTVLNRALDIASRSQGYFDPTVYPLVALWRVNFKKEKGEGTIPDSEEVLAVKAKVGYRKISFEPGKVSMGKGMSIDLSAIAKGSGVDGIAGVLEENGIENYLVEIGGEIRVRGENREGEPWRVLIAPVKNENEKANFNEIPDPVVLSLSDKAVATSGDYLNYFVDKGEKYSHLFDPHTGMPIRHYVTSVSVIADTCEEADGWATALIVMGEKGIDFSEREGIPAIFMVREGEDKIKVVKNSLVDRFLK